MSSPDGHMTDQQRIAQLEARLHAAPDPARQDQLRILLALERLTETVENLDDRQREDGKEIARRSAVIDEYRDWRTEVEREMANLREAWTRMDERYATRTELDEQYMRRENGGRLPPTAQKLVAVAMALVSLALVLALGGGELLLRGIQGVLM